ncbi:MAG: PAS domain-containing protein [Kiloniellales bacterium]
MADPSQAQDRSLADLYEFWLARRDERGHFHFAQFDVTEMPRSLLPFLYLIKVDREAKRFKVRIAGDQVVRLAGLNASGRYIDEIPGAERSQARMALCLEHDLPYISTDPLTWGAFDYKSFSVCVLPLHDDEGNVAYMLAAICVHGLESPTTQSVQAGLLSSNLPRIDSALHEEAFAYWMANRAGGGVPLRTCIDPVAIPTLLSHVIILDVLREPLDFRYRLIGDMVQPNVRRGLEGETLRNLPGKGPDSAVFKGLKKVVETGIPRYGRTPYEGPRAEVDAVFDLLLPFSEDGASVSHILIVAEFHGRSDVIGPPAGG